MKTLMLLLLLILFSLYNIVSHASNGDDIITVRSSSNFATTLVKVNELIDENDYKVTITQRCDFGLDEAGFKTDKYRIVFFGKLAEVRAISGKYPQLAPFLPLRIMVIAEDKQAIVASLNPALFLETVKDPELIKTINKWKMDIEKILAQVKNKF